MAEEYYVGKYRLVEEIGKGGFGTVYRAVDTVLDVERAIKVLHPALLSDSVFIARFRQEAQISAKLDHPNVVPVYDFGEAEGRFFLAMKYMPSGSLKELLDKNQRLNEEQTLKVFEQVANGLAYIHSKGIIHRDLKPRNILFDDQGNARISDMGFAKTLSGASHTSLSISGAIMGTPAYMAPEIWRGKAASEVSDIYSLGCIFVEMLTGKILFDGDSPADVMTKHVLEGPKLDQELLNKYQSFFSAVFESDPENRNRNLPELVKMIRDANANFRKTDVEPKISEIATSASPQTNSENVTNPSEVHASDLSSQEVHATESVNPANIETQSSIQVKPIIADGVQSHKPSVFDEFRPEKASNNEQPDSHEPPISVVPPLPPKHSKVNKVVENAEPEKKKNFFTELPVLIRIMIIIFIIGTLYLGYTVVSPALGFLSPIPTLTNTATSTVTITPSFTPTKSQTPTYTPTLTSTATFTPTMTRVIPTKTPTPTETPVPPPSNPGKPAGPILIQ